MAVKRLWCCFNGGAVDQAFKPLGDGSAHSYARRTEEAAAEPVKASRLPAAAASRGSSDSEPGPGSGRLSPRGSPPRPQPRLRTLPAPPAGSRAGSTLSAGPSVSGHTAWSAASSEGHHLGPSPSRLSAASHPHANGSLSTAPVSPSPVSHSAGVTSPLLGASRSRGAGGISAVPPPTSPVSSISGNGPIPGTSRAGSGVANALSGALRALKRHGTNIGTKAPSDRASLQRITGGGGAPLISSVPPPPPGLHRSPSDIRQHLQSQAPKRSILKHTSTGRTLSHSRLSRSSKSIGARPPGESAVSFQVADGGGEEPHDTAAGGGDGSDAEAPPVRRRGSPAGGVSFRLVEEGDEAGGSGGSGSGGSDGAVGHEAEGAVSRTVSRQRGSKSVRVVVPEDGPDADELRRAAELAAVGMSAAAEAAAAAAAARAPAVAVKLQAAGGGASNDDSEDDEEEQIGASAAAEAAVRRAMRTSTGGLTGRLVSPAAAGSLPARARSLGCAATPLEVFEAPRAGSTTHSSSKQQQQQRRGCGPARVTTFLRPVFGGGGAAGAAADGSGGGEHGAGIAPTAVAAGPAAAASPSASVPDAVVRFRRPLSRSASTSSLNTTIDGAVAAAAPSIDGSAFTRHAVDDSGSTQPFISVTGGGATSAGGATTPDDGGFAASASRFGPRGGTGGHKLMSMQSVMEQHRGQELQRLGLGGERLADAGDASVGNSLDGGALGLELPEPGAVLPVRYGLSAGEAAAQDVVVPAAVGAAAPAGEQSLLRELAAEAPSSGFFLRASHASSSSPGSGELLSASLSGADWVGAHPHTGATADTLVSGHSHVSGGGGGGGLARAHVALSPVYRHSDGSDVGAAATSSRLSARPQQALHPAHQRPSPVTSHHRPGSSSQHQHQQRRSSGNGGAASSRGRDSGGGADATFDRASGGGCGQQESAPLVVLPGGGPDVVSESAHEGAAGAESRAASAAQLPPFTPSTGSVAGLPPALSSGGGGGSGALPGPGSRTVSHSHIQLPAPLSSALLTTRGASPSPSFSARMLAAATGGRMGATVVPAPSPLSPLGGGSGGGAGSGPGTGPVTQLGASPTILQRNCSMAGATGPSPTLPTAPHRPLPHMASPLPAASTANSPAGGAVPTASSASGGAAALAAAAMAASITSPAAAQPPAIDVTARHGHSTGATEGLGTRVLSPRQDSVVRVPAQLARAFSLSASEAGPAPVGAKAAAGGADGGGAASGAAATSTSGADGGGPPASPSRLASALSSPALVPGGRGGGWGGGGGNSAGALPPGLEGCLQSSRPNSPAYCTPPGASGAGAALAGATTTTTISNDAHAKDGAAVGSAADDGGGGGGGSFLAGRFGMAGSWRQLASPLSTLRAVLADGGSLGGGGNGGHGSGTGSHAGSSGAVSSDYDNSSSALSPPQYQQAQQLQRSPGSMAATGHDSSGHTLLSRLSIRVAPPTMSTQGCHQHISPVGGGGGGSGPGSGVGGGRRPGTPTAGGSRLAMAVPPYAAEMEAAGSSACDAGGSGGGTDSLSPKSPGMGTGLQPDTSLPARTGGMGAGAGGGGSSASSVPHELLARRKRGSATGTEYANYMAAKVAGASGAGGGAVRNGGAEAASDGSASARGGCRKNRTMSTGGTSLTGRAMYALESMAANLGFTRRSVPGPVPGSGEDTAGNRGGGGRGGSGGGGGVAAALPRSPRPVVGTGWDSSEMVEALGGDLEAQGDEFAVEVLNMSPRKPAPAVPSGWAAPGISASGMLAVANAATAAATASIALAAMSPAGPRPRAGSMQGVILHPRSPRAALGLDRSARGFEHLHGGEEGGQGGWGLREEEEDVLGRLEGEEAGSAKAAVRIPSGAALLAAGPAAADAGHPSTPRFGRRAAAAAAFGSRGASGSPVAAGTASGLHATPRHSLQLSSALRRAPTLPTRGAGGDGAAQGTQSVVAGGASAAALVPRYSTPGTSLAYAVMAQGRLSGSGVSPGAGSPVAAMVGPPPPERLRRDSSRLLTDWTAAGTAAAASGATGGVGLDRASAAAARMVTVAAAAAPASQDSGPDGHNSGNVNMHLDPSLDQSQSLLGPLPGAVS
ncbi:hypothetical protein CHLRE_02g145600v5 [Chlamydomonas reinhardtii]|uniref:Uncharacterized protein n=1 Tax=Chlamydomonas reinhardtii TaxID=3055 RepID=A0A2K3E3S0_CHLRE|nr:uncharacterized protein CHLRE_02g145600v5 [Chlamydomonas reinhardtii]PNW87434.1 hypothetical protein CHLRE_02g145600v5 [Chlamydomonas reinhardtii]